MFYLVSRVCFFSVFPFSCIHSLSLSLLLSLLVASGSYSGAHYSVSQLVLPGPKELGLPSSISLVQDPRGPALLLRIRADFRGIFGEPGMKGGGKGA